MFDKYKKFKGKVVVFDDEGKAVREFSRKTLSGVIRSKSDDLLAVFLYRVKNEGYKFAGDNCSRIYKKL